MTQEEYYKKYDKLKIAHEESFKGLVELDKFCIKHNIKYSLIYGTLLGAARHKSFVPWDDDVDVVMDRKNYEKFLSLSEKYSEKYIIANERTFPDRGIFTTRIMYKDSSLKEKTEQKFYYPSGVWIDVFVFDAVPKTKMAQSWHKLWCYAWDTWTYRRANHNYTKMIYKIIHKLVIWPAYFMKFSWMLKKMDKVTQKYNSKNTGLITSTNCRTGYVKPLPSKYFDDYIKMEFNGRKFMVIKEWEKALENQYGDWKQMPPVSERKPLHYK